MQVGFSNSLYHKIAHSLYRVSLTAHRLYMVTFTEPPTTYANDNVIIIQQILKRFNTWYTPVCIWNAGWVWRLRMLWQAIHWHPSIQQSAIHPPIRSVWPGISRRSLTAGPSPRSPLLRFPFGCCHVCWPTATASQWLSQWGFGQPYTLSPPASSLQHCDTSHLLLPLLLLVHGRCGRREIYFLRGQIHRCVCLFMTCMVPYNIVVTRRLYWHIDGINQNIEWIDEYMEININEVSLEYHFLPSKLILRSLQVFLSETEVKSYWSKDARCRKIFTILFRCVISIPVLLNVLFDWFQGSVKARECR